MTLLVFVLVSALLVAAVVGWAFRRRVIERERRRIAALTTLATRLDTLSPPSGSARAKQPTAANEPSPRPPAPLAGVVPGRRAAFVAAVEDALARARADDARLAIAVVEAPEADSRTIADDVRGIVGSDVYTVGPRSLSFVLPGAGRAEALGVLTRIVAACGATGHAEELAPGEDAVELIARLLSSSDSATEDSGARLEPRP
jgi:hypothetical protein